MARRCSMQHTILSDAGTIIWLEQNRIAQRNENTFMK